MLRTPPKSDLLPVFSRVSRYRCKFRAGKLFADNLERSAFFARSVIRTIRNLGWQPDIVHAFGWLAGLVPYVLRTEFGEDELFKDAKVVYTPDTVNFDARLDEDGFGRLSLQGHEKLVGQSPTDAGQIFADATIFPQSMAATASGAVFSGAKETEMDEATAIYDSVLSSVPA